jgi:hypothetical protein
LSYDEYKYIFLVTCQVLLAAAIAEEK